MSSLRSQFHVALGIEVGVIDAPALDEACVDLDERLTRLTGVSPALVHREHGPQARKTIALTGALSATPVSIT